ncbi:hypothetical protein LA080_013081 [Diaporthe eres]|uniref:Jacalin-type lectin domain-containing protein n=1 Tax=Diaporthe vaccinii TaxID=105482 RepID=A0ABR4EAF5_9PEZI|nr:hypothetical protein LA080_013081 [Diaporthe eres]
MGIFRPDNSKRGQRCVSLTNQAQLYYDLHQKQADSCESSSKRLFAAVNTIATAQGKTLTQALGLPGGFENAVFEGGFEYHGLESVGKTISFSQWFILASWAASGVLLVGAEGLTIYTGYLFTVMVDGAALAGTMSIRQLWAVGRAARAGGLEIGLAGRWARFARFARTGSAAFAVLAIGVDAWCDEQEYNDLVKAIHDLAPMRLDACAHELMMESVSKRMSELAVEAEVYAKNPKIVSSFNILEEFSAVTNAVIADFKEVPDRAFATVKKVDKDQDACTTDDPDLKDHVFDLNNAAPSKIIQLDISPCLVVDWLQAQTNHGYGLRFGGNGGAMISNKVEDGELITRATWNTGAFVTKKVIFNLVIVTSKRSLGPFGIGGDEVKADEKEQTFSVPDKFRVCGVMDAASKVVEDEHGNATMVHQPYISDLRFVLAPVK